jgi:ornithine carbamoyltransferase
VRVTAIGEVINDHCLPRFIDAEGKDMVFKRPSYTHF